jgi:hypothetical protein
VTWLFPLAVGVVGLITLAVLANRARRELAPTVALVDRFGREHRVALTAALQGLRDETAHTHGRLSID